MVEIILDDTGRQEDLGFVEGCWGTITDADVLDEGHYDERSESDDLGKGGIKFPEGKLYGRDEELQLLRGLYNDAASSSKNAATVTFIGGFSGVGKSALVAEHVRQVGEERPGESVICARGKYSQQSAAVPLSAISDALGQLATEVMKPDRGDILQKIRRELCDDTMAVMSGTFPCVTPLFDGDESQRGSDVATMGQVKDAFRDFMSSVCSCLESPLMFFLDDCQWGCDASFQILTEVFLSNQSKNIVYICSYRSNEVKDGHAFHTLKEKVKNSQSRAVSQIDLFVLSPEDIGDFISDTLGKDDASDVATLTEVIYGKTMGNIFHVKQAMEELVRKNALFYDVMLFMWDYNVSRVQLESYLSDDLIGMVKLKINALPREARMLVVVMSFLPNNTGEGGITTLEILLEGEGVDRTKVKRLLSYTVKAGLVMQQRGSNEIAFAHDKIREAAFTIIPDGKPRDELLVRISNTLIDLANSNLDAQWALFVAADHMNSVEPNLVPRIELSHLNFRVGEIHLSKGVIFCANESFLISLKCLDDAGEKWQEYEFTLQLLNELIPNLFSMGRYELAFEHIQDVLQNASSLDDQATAYVYKMKSLAEGENRDYRNGVVEGLKICELYGIKLRECPTASDLMKENMQLKAVLRNRPLTVLSELPPAEDSPALRVLDELHFYSRLSEGCNNLATLASDRAIRLTLQRKCVSKAIVTILVRHVGSILKDDPSKIKSASNYAAAAEQVSGLFQDDRALYAESQFILHMTMFSLTRPYRTCLESVLDTYRPLLSAGKISYGLGCGMGYAYMYLSSGLPLSSPLLEPKLVLFGEYARQHEQPTFEAIYSSIRLLVGILQHRTRRSYTELKGDEFDEDAFLGSIDGIARSTTLRDTSTFRLFLAFIFWDVECMISMLDILADFASPDIMPVRSHFRLCIIGIAGYEMGRRNKDRCHLRIAKKCLEYFKALSKVGSPNATPVYRFMKAAANPSKDSYDKAIAECREARFIHLSAMAYERCGVYLEAAEKHDTELSKQYITSAYWLYSDWGASSKVSSLLQQYPFLEEENERPHTAPSEASSSGMRLANQFGRN